MGTLLGHGNSDEFREGRLPFIHPNSFLPPSKEEEEIRINQRVVRGSSERKLIVFWRDMRSRTQERVLDFKGTQVVRSWQAWSWQAVLVLLDDVLWRQHAALVSHLSASSMQGLSV